MKNKVFTIFLSILLLPAFGYGQLAPAKDVVDLPLFVDFNLFNGINLEEVHPGWMEAKGDGYPQFASSSWYRSAVLYETPAAGVTLSSTSKREWIISPQFVATAETKINFKAALTRFYDDPAQGNFGFDDSVSIMVSTNWPYFDHVMYTFKVGNQPGVWLSDYEVNLGQFAGQTIMVAFYATDGNEETGGCAFQLDDIEIKNAVAKDVMVQKLIAPISNQCFTAETPVKVRIKNDGTQTIYSIPVKAALRGEKIENIFGVWTGTLLPGQSADFEIGSFDMSAAGDYQIRIHTQLPGDTYAQNDAFGPKSFTHKHALELPLPIMDFTSLYDHFSAAYPDWYEARGKNYPLVAMNTDWQGDMFAGSRTASVYFVALGTEDWLVGPKISVTQHSAIKLKAAAQYEQGTTMMGSDDKLALMVSTDCGLTWTQKAAIDRGSNLGSTFQDFHFGLGEYAGQEIRIAFYATTGNVNDPQKFILHIDDVLITESYQYDAAVTRIITPGNQCSFGDAEVLTVEIKNLGEAVIQNLPVSYQFNENVIVTQTHTQAINPGQTIEFTFTQTLDFSLQNTNYLSVYTDLQADENPLNNGLFNLVMKPSSFDLATMGAYTMGFEDDEDFEDWLIENTNGDNLPWVLNTNVTYSNTGSNSMSYMSNNSTVQSNDWLFSPCFNLFEGETYKISFYYRNRATNFPEMLRLMMGSSQHSSAMSTTVVDLGSISNGNFIKSETLITVPASGEYYFGWHAYGPADMFGLYIDDVEIRQVFDNDLSVTRLVVPREKDDNSCELLPSGILKITVENKGSQEVTSVPLAVKINQEEVLSFTFPTTLASNEVAVFDFPLLEPVQAGMVYDIKAWTELAGDINYANDTLWLNDFLLNNYNMSFEEYEDVSEWTTQSVAGNNQWQIITDPALSHSGSRAFAIRTDSNGGNTINDDWLFSECFNLEAGKCYTISFWYRSRFSTENLRLHMGGANSAAGMNTLLLDLGNFNTNVYVQAVREFTVEEDGVYYFGWHTDGPVSGRYFVYVDDVVLVEDTSYPTIEPEYQLLDFEVAFFANAENIVSYLWDFGDGQTSEEANPFHVYAQEGTYTVSLTAQGGCASVEATFEIEILCPVEAAFDFETDGNEVSFTATVQAAGYEWVLGDGSIAHGQQLVHQYPVLNANGTYTVQLTVFNACGSAMQQQDVLILGVGVNEHFVAQGIKSFPNPVRNQLQIVAAQEYSLISLVNLNGQIVWQESQVKSGRQLSISVEALPSGVYLLHAISSRGIETVKIVKE